MQHHRVIVTRHRPRLRAAALAAFVGLLVVGAVAIFQYARHATVSGYEETRSALEVLRDDRRELGRQLREATRTNEALREQIAYLERSQEIDDAAADELRAELVDLQKEASQLREQIAFYKVIVSPDKARSGAQLLEAKLIPAELERQWRLELVLIQSMQRSRMAEGRVSATIIGHNADGDEQQLPMASLLLPESRLDAYAFRYFQEMSASFALPADFLPNSIVITLDPQRGSSTEETREWADLIVDQPEIDVQPELPEDER